MQNCYNEQSILSHAKHRALESLYSGYQLIHSDLWLKTSDVTSPQLNAQSWKFAIPHMI
jgi:hypothetical protein